MDHPLDLAPAADEYAEYYGRYVSRVPRGDFFALLRNQADEVAAVFGPSLRLRRTSRMRPGSGAPRRCSGT